MSVARIVARDIVSNGSLDEEYIRSRIAKAIYDELINMSERMILWVKRMDDARRIPEVIREMVDKILKDA